MYKLLDIMKTNITEKDLLTNFESISEELKQYSTTDPYLKEYDNEMKREKVKYAMWLRVEQGLWPWNAPSGYMVDRNLNVKLSPHIPDKTCSEVYVQIFTKFATGLVSMADLVREYSKRKIYN